MAKAKLVLGRGLSALIQPRSGAAIANPSNAFQQRAPGERVLQVSLDEVVPSPLQPRREFKTEQLTELIDSIREKGIIQPLIVRKVDGQYELIAGERRWRAARAAGLTQVPIIGREATDQQVLELALIENIQRADLNVIEEALAYERLAREFNLRQEDIAAKVGKSRAAVANVMRLLDLESQVQNWLVQGRLHLGHAKILLAVKSQEEQRMLAEVAIRQNATVRTTERLVQAHLAKVQTQTEQPVGPGSRKAKAQSVSRSHLLPVMQKLENRLREHFGTNISLQHNEKKGSIEIEYYGTNDLQRILQILGLNDALASD